MNYKELKKIQKQWKGKVCFFGVGLIGCTWVDDLIKAIGFTIDFYCGSKKDENVIIKDEIINIAPQRL